MQKRKRDHHFVPQAYLRAWSDDGKRLWTYRLLVSDPQVPEWKQQSIRGIAYHQDLYTRRRGGVDSDEFETWLEQEIETPASGPLQKAVAGENMEAEDWAKLARFLAAQDLRTPLTYLEMRDRWAAEIPKLIDSVVEEAIRELERGEVRPREEGLGLFENPDGIFTVEVEEPKDEDDDVGYIKAGVVIGRGLWLENVRRLLNGPAAILGMHHWSIAEASSDTEWFTSDQPVMKLRFESESEYSFDGGWDQRGTEIMMPISPRFILYTQVGREHPPRFQFSRYKTYLLQRLFAKRAFRFIFARKRMRKATWFRPRVVDRERFIDEQQQWRDWNEDQGSVEV